MTILSFRTIPFQKSSYIQYKGTLTVSIVVITHCCGPGPKAKQKKFSITFDSAYTQKFINGIYIQTNGQITYLGDWHSHISSNLKPSITDRKELHRIADNKLSRLESPIIVITYYEDAIDFV